MGTLINLSVHRPGKLNGDGSSWQHQDEIDSHLASFNRNPGRVALRARWLGLLWLCAAGFSAAFSCAAADPNAGLPPCPKWTKTEQLKSKWGTLSLAELRTQAEQGNPEAQHYLGWRYSLGEGVPKDLSLAVQWFRKAADQGFALAQGNLGLLYLNGEGVTKDAKEAERWFTRAADQGLEGALIRLADLASQSPSPEARRAGYERFLELAAEQGNGQAACWLGYRLDWELNLASRFDQPSGAYWIAFAAHQNYVGAYNLMGWIYMEGNRGAPQDYDEARRWFEKGAEQNEPYCQLGLGMFELEVNRSHPDLEKAKSWMLKAAQSNCPKAWFQLGRLSELNDIPHDASVKPDYAEAARWYQRAVDAGLTTATERLAALVEEGKIQSTEDPIIRLRQLADAGNLKAQLDLAQRYLKGEAKPRKGDEEPITTMKRLTVGGYGPAMLALADLYRTGRLLPKDPVQALFLIHRAVRRVDAAWERFEDVREAARLKRAAAPGNAGLEKVYPLYIDAIFNNQGGASAARIAQNYLDGTYPANTVAACGWFSLAAAHRHPTAAAERERLLKELDPVLKQEAEQLGNQLDFLSYQGMP